MSENKFEEDLEGWARQFGDLETHADEVALFEAFEKHVKRLKELHDRALEETRDNAEAQSQIRSKLVEAVQTALVTPEGDASTAGKGAQTGGQGAQSGVLGIRRPREEDGEEIAKEQQSFETVAAHTKSLRSSHVSAQAEKALIAELKGVTEFDGKPVARTIDGHFANWGKTVSNFPYVIFEPRTVTGVQNVVQWATAKGKKVRGAGFRHTWANMYSSNENVLVSMIPVSIATDTHNVLQRPPLKRIEDGLSFVEVVNGGAATKDGKYLLRIGAATTNDEFRQWCLDNEASGGQWKYTLPLNVIMVEITFGGSNAPICHGAGIKHETLSDLVHSIEFINPLGQLQVVDDPDLLRAGAGAFGLMGIVTAITLKVDPMEYAEMAPNFSPVPSSIPPLNASDVPDALLKGWNPSDMPRDIASFESHCQNDYYAEWFWFSLQDKSWNNCWQTRKPNGDYQSQSKLLSGWTAFGESFLGIIAEATNKLIGMSGWLQTKLMGLGASMTLPDIDPSKPTLTPVIDALHFRRGIHNMRVVDMELEIELPLTSDGTKTDWSICRKAWWDVIQLVYKYKKEGKYPMRLALEMRVMGGSNIIMAPQYGNSNGTCSIEVLSSTQTPIDQWESFMQEVSNIWHSYKHPDGRPLTVRSHWAKQWESLKFGPNKVPAVKHFRNVVYRDQIPEFKKRLTAIAKSYTGPNGETYTQEDMQRCFSTPLLDELFFTAPSPN